MDSGGIFLIEVLCRLRYSSVMFSDTTKLYTNTNPINKTKVAEAIREFYRFCNSCPQDWRTEKDARPSRDPEIIFVGGPKELKEKINMDEPFFHAKNFDDITHFVTKRGWGPEERMHSVLNNIFSFNSMRRPTGFLRRKWASPILLAIDYLYDDGKQERDYKWEWGRLASKIWDNAYLIVTFANKCFVVDRPAEIKVNDVGFHCTDGPALVFRDGSEVYCYEGLKVKKRHLLKPKEMTLKDIHQHNSRKHYMIDMVGVDHYLELVKAWKPPETKGRFQKFFEFANMVLPGDDLPDKVGEWSKKGYGRNYVDKPYEVEIYCGKMNGEYGLCMSHKTWDDIYFFKYGKNPLDTKAGQRIFDEADRELWNLFDLQETFNRSSGVRIKISYQNKEFRVKSEKLYGHHPACRHDIAPSWFKAKMFRGQSALYETEKYGVKWEDGNFYTGGEFPSEPRDMVFGGLEGVPSYQFDLDLVSDSWEGLLEKWAIFAFDWLGLHEDSARMP